MSFELILHLIIDVAVTLLILYIILKHIREAEKFYNESRLEWIQQHKNDKKLEEKLETYHLLCKLDKVCLIGVGGGGCNILEDIAKFDNRHKFIHINSDLQALELKTSKHKILLGFEKKVGLGCGGKEQCGQSLIDDDIKNQLLKLTKDEKIVYIISTLGGGVGSGATPEVVEYLKTLDKEIIVFTIMPFAFEGKIKLSIASNAISKILSSTVAVIILNNDELILNANSESTGFRETFKAASNVVYKRIADGI